MWEKEYPSEKRSRYSTRMQSILTLFDRNEECCPLLLEVLSTSQGTLDAPEKKIATLETIYGMLIHSRDPLASGIQRMYSTLAIRYHADNKVLKKTR